MPLEVAELADLAVLAVLKRAREFFLFFYLPSLQGRPPLNLVQKNLDQIGRPPSKSVTRTSKPGTAQPPASRLEPGDILTPEQLALSRQLNSCGSKAVQ
jgi:hypothetical protein